MKDSVSQFEQLLRILVTDGSLGGLFPLPLNKYSLCLSIREWIGSSTLADSKSTDAPMSPYIKWHAGAAVCI